MFKFNALFAAVLAVSASQAFAASSEATIEQTGKNQLANVYQEGVGQTSEVYQTGFFYRNTATTQQSGQDNFSQVTQDGA